MSLTTSVRRPLASIAAFAVLATSLVVAPLAVSSASAATDAAQSASILSKLNAYRKADGLPSMKTYKNLSLFAQEYAETYSLHKEDEIQALTDYDHLPALNGPTQFAQFRLKGIAQDKVPAAAAAKLKNFSSDDGSFDSLGDWDYAGIGYEVRSGYTYIVAFAATYQNKLQSPVDPVVTGTYAVGKTLTASISGWSPSKPDAEYIWFAGNDSLGEGTTLKLTPATRGKEVRVAVVGTKEGYEPMITLSKRVTVGYGTLNAKTPTVTGSRAVGKELTAVTGNWGSGVTFSYQWLRNGKAISNATGATYTQKSADKGAKVTVKVTGKAVAYKATTKYSATSATTAGSFVAPQPTITGGSDVGDTLTARRGTWSPAPTSYEYRWYLDGVRIAGQAKNTYTIAAADPGHTITVTIVGAKSGYRSAAVTSEPFGIPSVEAN